MKHRLLLKVCRTHDLQIGSLMASLQFYYSAAQGQTQVLPIMTATEIDEIRKRWSLRVCNVCHQKLSKQHGDEETQGKRSFISSRMEVSL
jgi:hypothetical protein